ncbi:hypothetical protein PICMEDRAFT_57026 [Pichia membranifaciens NRRL Y-2026]|uniref:Peptidase S8/S53 domain-containing protein n=1 Tax=Pichia membranifaciens NRRL Y-2026 TaxID=763406 RepID=A0A1E3NS42_9ASCO|nr:hypothetical protein PICMEDRAFT_57026 [Pichia membranifaciens NRRL Y-2026]ODQ48864.1 hypothetical protein PICMEDRAFT_57026 [Pichia membranifaciens NRRL Y-2026]
MKLATSLLLALTGSCLGSSFNTSSIIDYNVTRSSYHIAVGNDTDYSYWSLMATNASLSYADGYNVTVAIIGDGVNSKYLLSNDSVHSVLDVYSNSTYLFSENELTEDTLAAKVLLANAPATKIKSYKIFKNSDSTTSITSKLVSAVLTAVNDKSVDFIYINTWQAYGGWSESYLSELMNEAGRQKPIVLPMGQSNGIFQFSDGAAAENVIAVGGAGYEGVPGFATDIDGEIYGVYAEKAMNLWANNTLVLGQLDSNCRLKSNVSDHESNLLFIDVGNCSSDQIVETVIESNFTQLLTTGEEYQLYNFSAKSGYTSAMIGRENGMKILKRLENGDTIVAHKRFDENMIVVDYEFDEYSINFNSSMGPTLDLYLKPNIIAQSAFFFDDLNVYASGTSLSAAYVAGVVAAYASGMRDKSWYNGIVDRVTTSGDQVNFRNLTHTSSEIENPIVQGGGIINAEDFVLKNYDISPGFFALKEAKTTSEITFSITNNNDKAAKRFHISGLDAITIYSQDLDIDANNNNMYPFPIYGNVTAATVVIEKNTILVPGGKSVNVTVLITPPNYCSEADRIPVYGGYIQVKDLSTNIVSSIPYFGSTVEFHSLETQTDEEFYWKEFHYEPDGRYCDMWVNGSVVNDTNHFMQIYFNDRIGSPLIDILVVEKDWTETDFVYPPVPGQNKFIERIQGTRYPGGYPWHYAPRSNTTLDDQWDDWHDGLLANGSVLPAGEYKILLRILKHNVQDPSDWDEWYNHVSPWFVMDYANVTEVDLPLTTISISQTTLKTVSTSAAAASTSSMDMAGMHM